MNRGLTVRIVGNGRSATFDAVVTLSRRLCVCVYYGVLRVEIKFDIVPLGLLIATL